MSSADMDRRMAEIEAAYPALFQAFRTAGWSEAWRADAGQLAGEPYFDHPRTRCPTSRGPSWSGSAEFV